VVGLKRKLVVTWFIVYMSVVHVSVNNGVYMTCKSCVIVYVNTFGLFTLTPLSCKYYF
jgi:hypothetical protein